jgi:choline-glycine betaine transporter
MYSQAFLKLLCFFWFIVLLILMSGSFTKAISKDDMEVRRDKDKTTYSIGPSEKKNNEKTEEEKDKERAWDMLKNMNTIIDKREQNRQKNGQPGGK